MNKKSEIRTIRATFIGARGSCGYRTGLKYDLKIREIGVQPLTMVEIEPLDTRTTYDFKGKAYNPIRVSYSNFLTFLDNWAYVRVLKT